MSLTQHQKIVALMCIEHNKRWWKPHEIINTTRPDFFVGYETSARMSELAREYPTMIETRQAGKYKERRMCFETGKSWYRTLPTDLQAMFKRYYKP